MMKVETVGKAGSGIVELNDSGEISYAENTTHSSDAALERVFDQIELKETCFSDDTVVHMEDGKFKKIEYVAVGDKVLSRCEITGEMAYKKVIKTFEHLGRDDGEYFPAVIVEYTTNDPKGTPAEGFTSP